MVNEVDVTIRGHVGHDPTIFRGEGRRSYVRLNVASTPRIRTREGEWADGATQWFTVKLFGDLAENTAVSIRKGDAVLVRGRLEHEEYETREGERRWSAVVMAESFGPELRYASAHVTRSVRRAGAEPAGEAGAAESGAADGSESGVTSGADADGESAARAPQEEVDTSAFEDFPATEGTENTDDAAESGHSGDTLAAKIA